MNRFNRTYYIRFVLLLILACFITLSFSQSLKIDTSYSPGKLVDGILTGDGVRVGNVKLTGSRHSIGAFSIDTSVIGMKEGILLSTGRVKDISHENVSPGTSGMAHDSKKRYRPDRELAKICGGRVCDHIAIEFDFIPFNNEVSFNFCFASEEYTEYVGSAFNDAFAFILKSNGERSRNLAMIPGTNKNPTSGCPRTELVW